MAISSKHCMVFIALVFLMMFNNGCMAPVALHAAGEAAGGAAPSSFSYLGRGKGESYFIARYDDVVKAAQRAGEVLSLEMQDKKVEAQQASLLYDDGKSDKIKLLIEQRTDTMTSVTFEVGWFGSLAFSHLMARQIIFELSKAHAFLEDRKPQAPNY
jgi:hypothetical protein